MVRCSLRAMSLSEKILARASGREFVSPGDIVDAAVDVAYTHDWLGHIAPVFEEIGAPQVFDPKKIVVILDHWVPAPTEAIAALHDRARKFVEKYGIENFYDIGRHGIAHQVMVEEGFIAPGDLVIASDSHTNMGGALGAFAAGVGTTEAAAVFATGKIWLRVPENFEVELDGRMGNRTVAKDVILKVISEAGDEGASYRAVEFTGSTVKSMRMNERLTLTNMTTEMGAKTGVIASDDVTKEYLKDSKKPFRYILSDEGATYQKELHLNVRELEPQVALPSSPENVKPVREVQGIKINQAFLGSCTNARLEDLREAAEILRGEKVHKVVRMIVSPASTRIYNEALREGLLQVFVDAGATVSNSSCGPCFGGHLGVLSPGETCVSTSNRNYAGRMGSPKANIYLASPYTVAASAVYGELTDPREV